jgi:inward rectifier potassium channel
MAPTKPVQYDPGLSNRVDGKINRFINPDGSFNIKRSGLRWRDHNVYQHLISVPWPHFLGILILGYLLVNSLFAGIYLLIGIENLQGAVIGSPGTTFLNAFFFSCHTLTTVGYGSISPKGNLANLAAAFEAAVGLLGFALATSLFYGRFSKPSLHLVFSKNAIVAPYQDSIALEFRVVNGRTDTLMELSANVLIITVETQDGQPKRIYRNLTLERSSVQFMPLTWTIVHPIDQSSPFFGKTPAELAALETEILVLIKGFDDTFSQWVHAMYSYRSENIRWGERFVPAFRVDAQGEVVVQVDHVHDTESVPLPGGA